MNLAKMHERMMLQEEKEVKKAMRDIKKRDRKLYKDIEKHLTLLMNKSSKWEHEELLKYGRLDKTLRAIEDEIKQARKDNYKIITALLLYSGLRRQNTNIESLREGKIEIKNKDPKLIKEAMETPWSGATIKERYNKGTINEIDRVKQSVIMGAINGDYRGSIEGVKKAVIVSATASAIALMVTEKTYIDQKITLEKSKKVMYNAILDNSTCDECSSRDGREYDKDSAPSLPAHTNCRCFYSPIE